MRRRYDLERSDNLPYTGKKAYPCSGNGFITINTGFPVRAATITWSSLPSYDAPFEMSSSSSSSSSTSLSSESSSSSKDSSSSSSSSMSSGQYLYQYCADGCVEPGVDGTYTHTGNYWNELPTYFNGTCYLYYQLYTGEYFWVIDPVIADESSTLAYQWPSDPTPQGIWEDTNTATQFNVFTGACSSSSSSNSSSSSSESSESAGGNVTSSSSSSTPPSIIVTWTGAVGTPDGTGEYFEYGLYNGRMAYRRGDGAYWLYWNSSAIYWAISATLGGSYLWANNTPPNLIPPTGTYFNGMPSQPVDVNYYESSSSESIGNTSSSSSSNIPDYIVEWDTVSGTPDGTGDYYEDGTFNSRPKYRRGDGAYWLYYNNSWSRWIINSALTDAPWLTGLWWYTATPMENTPNLGTYISWAGSTQDVKLILPPEHSSSSSTSSSSSESTSSSSSESTNEYPGPFNRPRIYVYDYVTNGFRVRYENIPEEVGFVEFAYVAF